MARSTCFVQCPLHWKVTPRKRTEWDPFTGVPWTSICRLSGELTPFGITGMKTVFWADNINPLSLRERTMVFTSFWKIFRADFCRGPFLFGRLTVVVLQMAKSPHSLRYRRILDTRPRGEMLTTMAQQQLHIEQPPVAVEGMEVSPFPLTEDSLSESGSEEEGTIGGQKRPHSPTDSSYYEEENTTVRGQKRPRSPTDSSYYEEENTTVRGQKRPRSPTDSSYYEEENTTVRGQKRPRSPTDSSYYEEENTTVRGQKRLRSPTDSSYYEEENTTVRGQKRPRSPTDSSYYEEENTTVRGQKRVPAPAQTPLTTRNRATVTTLTKYPKRSPPLENANKEPREGALNPHRETNQPARHMRVLSRPAHRKSI